VVALAVVACRGEPPAADRALLRDFQLDPSQTAGAAGSTCPGSAADRSAAEPRGVVRSNSRRESVVTCRGVALRVAVDLPARPVLDLSLALVEAARPRAKATATVELRREGGSTVLLEAPVDAGPWVEHRIELPEGERGELVLRSAGAAPVAWSELHLGPGEAAGAEAAQEGRGADEPPSLILVSLDTVRADHLSLYGYERATTPRLERLGAESLVFTRALSSSTWTLPSTATLLTGLLPSQHGAVHVTKRLPDDVVTVAERLRDAGYRTAALTDGGFVGFPFGLPQGFERYDVTPGEAWQPRAKDAARTFGEAADWVRRNRHRPFFLFLHTYEAHQPYLYREGFAAPFLAPEDRGNPDLSLSVDPNHPERARPQLARMVALYDGEIARADHYLGGFLDALEAAGLAGEVAVVVTSDHGEEFLEHGDLEHAFGKVYDPNVRVPLVVSLPAGREPAGGRRLDVPVSGIDVAPTLLDLAGLPHDDLPGRSLLEVAREAEGTAARSVLVHGLPSFPNLTAERFRLDRPGDPAVILDRPRADEETTLLRYQPLTDEAAPWQGPTGGDTPVPRLATLLAWTQAGHLFARLPSDATHLAVPEGSRIRPTALWTGQSWVKLRGQAARSLEPGRDGLDLAPQGPHVVVFSLASEGGRWSAPWELTLTRSGATEPCRLAAERRPPWDPFTDPLPPEGAVLPTAMLRASEAAKLDDATAKELKSLGYLQ
jgi:arylsulfatase A-like enzyme